MEDTVLVHKTVPAPGAETYRPEVGQEPPAAEKSAAPQPKRVRPTPKVAKKAAVKKSTKGPAKRKRK